MVAVPSDPLRLQRSGFDAFEDTRSELRLLNSQPSSTEYDLGQIRNCFPELFDAGSNDDELRKRMCAIPLAAVDQTTSKNIK